VRGRLKKLKMQNAVFSPKTQIEMVSQCGTPKPREILSQFGFCGIFIYISSMNQIIRIKKTQARKNPFNHKCAFQDNEGDALQESLSHYGLIGALVVIPDYTGQKDYIMLDGHSRYNMLDEFDAVVYVGKPIKCDDDLKRLTIYYLSAQKRRDSKKLTELFFNIGGDLPKLNEVFAKLDLSGTNLINDSLNKDKEYSKPDLQENEVVSDAIFSTPEKIERFSELVTMEFTSEAAYNFFMELKGRAHTIATTGKIPTFLNQINKLKDLDRLIEKHLMEVLVNAYSDSKK
jgi:hypothetical protein